MADVVERIKVPRSVPKELATFDEIEIVAREPEMVLRGRKAGRSRPLGKLAAAQALELVQKSGKVRRSRSASTSSKQSPQRSGGGGGSETPPAVMEQLRGQVADLESNNTDLTDRLRRVEKKLDEVLERNKELDEEKQKLETRNQELENKLQAYRTGKLDVVYAHKDIYSDSRLKKSFNVAAGWVGSRLPWGGEPVYTKAHIDEDLGKPVVVLEEERVDGYSENQRRRGAAAILGGLALAGVMALVIYELSENDGNNPNVTRNQTTIIEQNHKDTSIDSAVLKALQDDKIRDMREKTRERQILNSQKTIIKLLRGGETKTTEQEHGSIGRSFPVKPGNGITNEIQDYAPAHGYREVSGSQAWMLYLNGHEEFGDNLITTPSGGDDTYIRPEGDVGISQPGPAKFDPQFEAWLRNHLTSAG